MKRILLLLVLLILALLLIGCNKDKQDEQEHICAAAPEGTAYVETQDQASLLHGIELSYLRARGEDVQECCWQGVPFPGRALQELKMISSEAYCLAEEYQLKDSLDKKVTQLYFYYKYFEQDSVAVRDISSQRAEVLKEKVFTLLSEYKLSPMCLAWVFGQLVEPYPLPDEVMLIEKEFDRCQRDDLQGVREGAAIWSRALSVDGWKMPQEMRADMLHQLEQHSRDQTTIEMLEIIDAYRVMSRLGIHQ